MIKLKNIYFSYGKDIALKDISLDLEMGKLYAVIGPNGSGKTTLIKLLSRHLKQNSGEILLDNKEYKTVSRKEFAKRISLMPQGRNTPDIRVLDLVSYGRYPYLDFSQRFNEEDCDCIRFALEITNTVDLAELNLKNLSGGERQRVYLAMLLAQNTPYVLLDEPTTYLDISAELEVIELFNILKQRGKCIVSIMHNIGTALKFADQIIVMDKGKIVSVGSAEETVNSGVVEKVFGVKCKKLLHNQKTEYIFDNIKR